MTEKTKDEMLKEFMKLILSDADLGEFCDVAEKWLKNPVAITLTTRTIVGHSAGYTNELMNEYSNHMEFLDEKERVERLRCVDALLGEKKAFVGTFPMMSHPHINCGCFHENNLLGVLDMPLINKDTDRRELLEAEEFMAPVFLQALRLKNYVTGDMKFSMQAYLYGLLNNDPEKWIQTHYIEDSALNNIKQWNVIYLPGDPANRKIFQMDKLYAVCSRYRCAWAVRYSGSIVILKKAYEHFNYDRLLSFIPEGRRFAVSEPFSDLKMILNHIHACQRTIDLANFEDSNDRILFVENYKMPISYLVLKRMPNGMSLYHPSIPLIKKFDEENGTEYFDTLKTYLLNSMDTSLIAEKLHVHKNTVSYRLSRLEEMFHLDLKDCRTITALYLSLFEDFKKGII